MENKTIEGRNPVYEALKADLPVEKIRISASCGGSQIKRIIDLARQKHIPYQTVPPEKIDELAQTASNQGVIAFVSEVPYQTVDDLFARAEAMGTPPFFVIADEITDPHNLGAMIRTANAVGAHGVIIPKNRSVGVNATVFKTSAGAASYVPVARVQNLARTIEDLKARGVWVFAADMNGRSMYSENLTGPIALVVGSEGKGISKNIREHCDFTVQIPMAGNINSLNASVAASVMMYEIFRQRNQ